MILKRIIISTLVMGLLASCTQEFDNEEIALENYTLDTVYTKEEAMEDIDFAMEKLKGHIYIEDTFPEEVQRTYEEVVGDFGEEVTELEIWRGVSRIYNEMNDGHTRANYIYSDGYYDLPVDFEYENDKLYMKTIEGKVFDVKSVGGLKVKKIFENLDEMIPSENAGYVEAIFDELKNREYLSLIGIDVSKKIPIKYYNEDNKAVTEYFEFEKNTDDGAEIEYYSYDIYEDENVGVFRFDKFYNIGQEYEELVEGFELFINEVEEAKIENIAIDLRKNGGGYDGFANYILAKFGIKEYAVGEEKIIEPNGEVYFYDYRVQPATRFLKDTYDGNLYFLISNYTFSQPIYFSAIVQDNDFGVIIGEEPGGLSTVTAFSVLGYAESKKLPNSNIKLFIPNRYIKRPDKNIDYPELRPDYLVEDDDLALEKLFEVVE